MSEDTPQQQIPEELKIDVDQEALAKWDAVSDDYAGEGEPEKHRPAFTDDKKPSPEGDASERDLTDPDETGETSPDQAESGSSN